MPAQFIHSPEFHIDLETDEILMNGSTEESAGVLLHGSVFLNCQEPTKIKAIRLSFTGTAKVHWSEGNGSIQRPYREEITLIQQDWSLLPLTGKSHSLEGQHRWEFELALPGHLPESIHHSLGSVTYRFKAIIERSTFLINYATSRYLHISRRLRPSFMLAQSVVISNVWANKIMYDISVPSKVYGASDQIPVTFSISPLTNTIRVLSVLCLLKEYTSFRSKGHHKAESRIIRYCRDDHFPMPQSGRWVKTEKIDTASSEQIQCDTVSELIQVKHKLKFTVSLMNSDGHVSELRAAIPVIISPEVPEELDSLPVYEEISQLPCIQALVEGVCNDWTNLSRVPSYGTALRSPASFPVIASPAYETIV
ncbi:hypothetical protein PHYBLDRAFT_68268 [Phycomyces blakesleeanus NRRL 1555(-)]|uniref:Arrestin C-terminal-like domain-containing protein n=2 Tax=Phycomyces blakesleeanus TaxID=4837 RepID=A0A167KEC6_PHYB8|nr:hypothetical protein PHYBLDRAFT_68268 [Phycomyces blakesleeanus NRRL 1555(-)]OAD67899.1 hypothetical protein PHYBLDRAFT_68268 [Phycomyces blakesleeanus NRRL 1555(-)]|eukprot:XP_018285939.1 hypothetical protein PHYBLDRAFT_68268 [Phycomyces blakesleeanus NRRL 1555(-)]